MGILYSKIRLMTSFGPGGNNLSLLRAHIHEYNISRKSNSNSVSNLMKQARDKRKESFEMVRMNRWKNVNDFSWKLVR